ncbi:MAG TPA: Xaa-Pro peptidase family protein [Candidatus Synoicihabitans sp.]|nr:Xaa-Pro peptidase family protein [Candidatus Synoicihabitans sp.]
MALPSGSISIPVAQPALLFYSDTQKSADLRYFAGFEVHDPFIALRIGRRRIAVLNALEYGRALKESAFDQVLRLEVFTDLAKADGVPQPGPADHIVQVLRKFRVQACVVPEDFPAGLFNKLQARGITLTVVEGAVLPEREIKSDPEAEAIREGNRCAALGLAAAEQMLRAATIKGSRLWLERRPLTSERVRFAMEVACLEAGAIAADTIVAGGDQACDPHCRGSGVLRPNELIIIDIFPRVSRTGYHGDMTRTFLRGEASDAQRQLVVAVADAQRAALAKLRAGVPGRQVHQQCLDVFAARGFTTKRTARGSIGFFHGTGHGLGLAIHEPPRLGAVDRPVPLGSVVTVEPGLYYPGLGGCRIEDVAQVTAAKPRLLSRYSYDWELR